MEGIEEFQEMIARTIDDMQSGRADKTVNGRCSGCGRCCSNILPISKREIERIRKYIRKHSIQEQVEVIPPAAQPNMMSCPFRSESKKSCLIYPVRPAICQDYLCSKPAKGVAPRFQGVRQEDYHL